MPRDKDDRSSVKDTEMYEALRDDGMSKEKAARISNAADNQSRSEIGSRGGHAEPYEHRTKDELLDRAREIGIDGRSKMNKGELIEALRNH